MHDEAPTPITEDMAGLYPEEAKIVDSALVFARTRLTTESARWEHARIHPRDAIVEAARLGLNRIEVALDRGGLGMRFLVKLRVAQALAREDMAFSFALVNAHNAVLRIARDGTPAHRERWLPGLLRGDSIGAICLTEPDAGSDFSGIRTRATRRPGGWTLVGEKAWATNAVAADHALVYAQTDPGLGYRGIAAFLVPVELPGVRRSEPESLVGAHAIGAGGFGFDGVELDEGALFYPPGEAFKRALASINGARTYVAGMCCAMLERSLELAYAYARERLAFGDPLWANQGLRWRLADVLTELEAARALTDRAATLIDNARSVGGADMQGRIVLAAAHAKKHAARAAESGLRECAQVLGARGLRDDLPIGRHLVCARVAHFVDGTTEMQNERIAALMPAALGIGAPAP
ncbi:MAG: acyl-CoA dehydrogenase family protein [Burkholderiaceae bacterium]|nr:acyl-CoA dehydrogenase family protein [Burkholderiaceae bacterium]